MKAILINANERKVVAADVKPDPNKSLEGIRALIGCEWVQPAVIGENLTVWVDEEGRLSSMRLPLNGIQASCGNGILLGGDASRARVCKASPEVIALGVRWLAPDQVPPPGLLQLVSLQ